jgi:hypothetical protein
METYRGILHFLKILDLLHSDPNWIHMELFLQPGHSDPEMEGFVTSTCGISGRSPQLLNRAW